MSGLASAFAGIKEAQAPRPAAASVDASAKPPAVTKAMPVAPQQAAPTVRPVTAKSSHQDYGSLKVYVRKDTRRRAERKWQDAGGGDLSDLVEHLLSTYAGS